MNVCKEIVKKLGQSSEGNLGLFATPQSMRYRLTVSLLINAASIMQLQHLPEGGLPLPES